MENQLKTKRKIKTGVVVSSKMDKTVVVRVDRKIRHQQYEKVIVRSRKYYAHDESNELIEGAEVSIMEIRPLSKLKRWCVVK
ncbi:MAG: small subunit ribosomal protein S17 [Chlamydiales bacterium]|jgi:small subunit ribosomal protein S17